MSNIDAVTVQGFGDEWSRFDQTGLDQAELKEIFEMYFRNFPWSLLPKQAIGFDLGCGSGRWAQLVAQKVGEIHCVDASAEALDVAKRNLSAHANVVFHHASVDDIPLKDGSMDFGYSLGVLHHVPNTLEGIRSCVQKLKPGAPFLLYLYYRFDNRPFWFVCLWKLSDWLRFFIARLPSGIRYFVTQAIALFVYFPLSRIAALLETCGVNVESFPLSTYRHLSFYTICTDSRDRFGTRLEHRFTRAEIEKMMIDAGLKEIIFNDSVPYWTAVGIKK